MGVGGQRRFTPENDPVPIVQEAGWAPGPVWTVSENLAPTGIRSPDRAAHSSVAIPTELSRPTFIKIELQFPFMLSEASLCIYCSYFVSSWNQRGALH
jgi:hypothetical protein